MTQAWRIATVGRSRLFLWTGWRVEGWRSFEYWDRLCLGWFYILRFTLPPLGADQEGR